MGTPVDASRVLRTIHNAGHEVVLVVTQPDRKRGRTNKLIPTPVKAVAEELGLAVTHKMKDVMDADADAGVIVQFGRLIKEPVLSRLTWLNLHPSLLPRWRGASPVESAILAGDIETGVCVMGIEEGFDTGPVYKLHKTTIGENETSTELSKRLFDKGAELLVETLNEGIGTPTPQSGDATYSEKFNPDSFRIDFSISAEKINRVIRLGRAWTTLDGNRFRILEARVGQDATNLEPGQLSGTQVGAGKGELTLVSVQPQNKAPMSAQAWLNGARLSGEPRFI